MRIVSLLPSTTEILFAIGAGDDVVGVTFECDHPAEAREPHDRVDQRDAGGADARARSTTSWRRRCSAATTSTTSTRAPSPAWTPTWSSPRTCARSARSTCRSSTTRWPTSAAPPRCSPSTRTRSPRCSSRSGCSAGPPAARPRPMPSCRTRTGASRTSYDAWAPARGPASCCWSGPTRRSRPATGSPRWSTSPAASRCSARAGEKSVRVTWDDVHAARPDVVVVAPCGYDRAGAQALADELVASGRAARRRTRARRRRQRLLGPPRHPPHRRDRGARRRAVVGPYDRVTGCTTTVS